MTNPRDKVQKLLRLHRSVPNTPEGRNALLHARRLMKAHGWAEQEFRGTPIQPSQKASVATEKHEKATQMFEAFAGLFRKS